MIFLLSFRHILAQAKGGFCLFDLRTLSFVVKGKQFLSCLGRIPGLKMNSLGLEDRAWIGFKRSYAVHTGFKVPSLTLYSDNSLGWFRSKTFVRGLLVA